MIDRMIGYLPNLLPAAGITIVITLISITLASLLGICVAAMQLSRFRFLRLVATAYVELVRNTPLLVQVFYIFYVVPYLVAWKPGPWSSGILAMTLYFGAYLAEIFRGGILGVDKRQWEAGDVLNLSRAKVYLHVVLPQAFRNVIPAWGNIFVGLFKATAVLSIITVNELMFQARWLGSLYFRYFEIYTLTTILYFLMCYPAIIAIGHIEQRLTANMRRTPWHILEQSVLQRAGR
jgi:polar amino acid transport system permease protein